MIIKLNIILATTGISFFLAIISCQNSNGQTWYDSEGRPLIIKGKKVIRKTVNIEESKKEIESVSSTIPSVLELKPELRTLNNLSPYKVFYPYSRYHYGYSGYLGTANYYRYPYYHYGQRCYTPKGTIGRNFYLNYRKGGLSIRARF